MIFSSNTMNINIKNNLAYLTFKELDKYNFINHAYSTRLGGISKNEFKSLNFGYKTNDNIESINKNYDIFCETMNIKKQNLVLTSQIHEDRIAIVTKQNIENNSDNFIQFDQTDGLITNEPNIGLVTFHADCVAVYLIDVKQKIIGLAHAGWRGTVKNITGKLVKKLVDFYKSSPENIVSALGPCIQSCCFEVDKSLLENFYSLNIPETYIYNSLDNNKIKIDLLQVNKELLIKSGLKSENIFKSDVCTMCNHELLFSHRATNGKRGTNIAYIILK